MEKQIHDMNFTELCAHVHKTAMEHGWWAEQNKLTVDGVGTKLALIHSEVSEALEELRLFGHDINGVYIRTPRISSHGKPDGFGMELADVVIRVMDLCGAFGLDLEQLIKTKMAYNETRSHRHGGKAA